MTIRVSIFEADYVTTQLCFLLDKNLQKYNENLSSGMLLGGILGIFARFLKIFVLKEQVGCI